MKFVVFTCLLALAVASPQGYKAPGARRDDSSEVVGLKRDDRHHNEDGSYSSDFESEDGISVAQSGARLDDVENNPVGSQGKVSFTFPTGEKFDLKFVANENGYQPESSWLPVAPEFPHPIPQFVLDQIEKAAREDAEEARSGRKTESYSQPEPTRKSKSSSKPKSSSQSIFNSRRSYSDDDDSDERK